MQYHEANKQQYGVVYQQFNLFLNYIYITYLDM